MCEILRTDSPNYDNFPLKRWLHRIGPARRYELLQKLKTDLQNLGLSRRQVRQGLLQLATKPRVILTRQSDTDRSSGSRKSSVEDVEKWREASSCRTVRTTACLEQCSRRKNIDAENTEVTETGTDEECKRSEEAGRIKTCKADQVNSSLGSLVFNRSCKLVNKKADMPLHSFDKTLKQLDKIRSLKVNVPEKSVGKMTTAVSGNTTNKSHDQRCGSDKNMFLSKKSACSNKQNSKDTATSAEDESNFITHSIPDLVADKVGRDMKHVFRHKKNHIKLNISSRNSTEVGARKPNVDRESETVSDVDSVSNKNKCHDHRSDKSKSSPKVILQKSPAVTDSDVGKTEENTQKKRPHDTVPSDFTLRRKKICTTIDEMRQANRVKRRKMKSKLRTCFGDCISISEDEQEQDILQRRFGKRRKKDSIDSCDSGVYTAEENGFSNCVRILKHVQKAVPDSTMQEELNEDTPVKIATETDPVKGLTNVPNCESSKLYANKSQKTGQTHNLQTRIKKITQEELTDIRDAEVKDDNSPDTCKVDSSQTGSEKITRTELPDIRDAEVENNKFQDTCRVDSSQTESDKLTRTELPDIRDAEVENNKSQDTCRVDSSQTGSEKTTRTELPDIRDAEVGNNKSQDTCRVDSSQRGSEKITRTELPGIRDAEVEGNKSQDTCKVGSSQAETGETTEKKLGNVCYGKVEKKAQNPKQVDNSQTERQDVSQAEVTNKCNENNLVQTVITGDVETSQKIETSEVNTAEEETDSDTNTVVYDALEMYNINSNKPVPKVFSKCEESTINVDDLNELLQINFSETCDITSNGNVLSIQENIRKDEIRIITIEDTDENSNLNILQTMQPNCDGGAKGKGEVSNNIDKEIHSKDSLDLDTTESNNSSFAKKNTDVVPTDNNMYGTPSNANQELLQEPELTSAAEKQDIQSDKGFQGRLRVLSSAELGSRWCPTPVISVAPTISQVSCINTMTMSDPLQSTVTVASSAKTIPATVSVTTNGSVGLAFETAVCTLLVNIYIFINRARASTPSLDYDIVLATEFSKLKKLTNTENYKIVTDNAVRLLNNELFTSKPLTLEELFQYTPILKQLYMNFARIVNNVSQSDTDACQYVTTVPTKTTTSQNVYESPQMTQNASAKPVHAVSHLNFLHNVLNQYVPNLNNNYTNGTTKEFQQNVQENAILQSRYNLSQNNITMNSTTNYGAQQVNYRMQTQQPPFQQKISQVYFSKPVAPNRVSYVPVSSANPSQPGKHTRVQMGSTPAVNQQYVPQNMYVQGNVLYNKNAKSVPNQPVQKQTSARKKNTPNVPAPSVNQQYQHTMYRRTPHVSRGPVRVQNASQLPQNVQHSIPQFIQNIQHNVPQIPPQNIQQNVPQLPQNIQHVPQLSQNVQHVPVINYTPQPVKDMFATNSQQNVTSNAQQNEKIHHKVPVQLQTKVPQNLTSEQMTLNQHIQTINSSKQQTTMSANSKGDTAQVSLESTVTQFDVLKYLSAIQKIMLLKHMNFYFGCTTWLQQQFTSEQWQRIHLQRSRLLYFQTLLKHLVEKTVKDMLQTNCQENESENNILKDIGIDVPKKVHIIVQENREVPSQNLSNTDQVQQKTPNTDQCNITRKENLDIIIVPTQPEKEEDVIDNSKNTHSSNQRQDSEVLQEENVEKNKQDKGTIHQNYPTIVSVLKSPKTSEIFQDENVQKNKQNEQANNEPEDHPSHMSVMESQTSECNGNPENAVEKALERSSDLCNEDANKQKLDESQKAVENISHTPQQEVPAAFDLKESNKDTLQQSNSHLITVEISSNNEQVTVIDTDSESRDTVLQAVNEESKECEQQRVQEEYQSSLNSLPSSSEDQTEDISIALTPKIFEDTENSNDVDTDDTLTAGFVISHIADVRSISLETFEKMGEDDNNLPSDAEENKVCLLCSKLSTIACSVCSEAKYCSQECSLLHWEEHYQDCKGVPKTVYL